MDKPIQFCTATELLESKNLNDNSNFLNVLEVINAMYDYIKTQSGVLKGQELELLNVSFNQVKPKLDKEILETIVHIKK